MSTAVARRSSLPGFGLTMGLTLTWLSVIILIPLAGLFLKTFELSPGQFWDILTSRRTLNALKISFGLSFAAACVNLALGYLSSILVSMVSVWRRGRKGLAMFALLLPVYWLLISLAAYRAAWQFVRDPYLWEKTEHGTARS